MFYIDRLMVLDGPHRLKYQILMAQTVLIVEDDADIARLVRMTLEDAGYTVRSVADGAAAWELATSGSAWK